VPPTEIFKLLLPEHPRSGIEKEGVFLFFDVRKYFNSTATILKEKHVLLDFDSQESVLERPVRDLPSNDITTSIINFFRLLLLLGVHVKPTSYVFPCQAGGGALAPPVDLYDVLGIMGLTDVKVPINNEYWEPITKKLRGFHAST